jgi:hypothetical protein
VVIEHRFIRNFNAAARVGVSFTPSNANALLMIRDSVITHNGSGDDGTGVLIQPNGGSAKVLINNTSINKNFVGLNVCRAPRMFRSNSNVSESLSTGFAQGGAPNVRIGPSMIVNNSGIATAGTVLSYGDNLINGNGLDTTPASAGGYK